MKRIVSILVLILEAVFISVDGKRYDVDKRQINYSIFSVGLHSLMNPYQIVNVMQNLSLDCFLIYYKRENCCNEDKCKKEDVDMYWSLPSDLENSLNKEKRIISDVNYYNIRNDESMCVAHAFLYLENIGKSHS